MMKKNNIYYLKERLQFIVRTIFIIQKKMFQISSMKVYKLNGDYQWHVCKPLHVDIIIITV